MEFRSFFLRFGRLRRVKKCDGERVVSEIKEIKDIRECSMRVLGEKYILDRRWR